MSEFPLLQLMPPTNVRYRVVAVSTLMAVLLYLDRFCISFAEIFIKEDLALSDNQVGWMLSAFFWTYALGQVPSGWLTDRYGARIMLTIYILSWSLFTGLTGAASAFSALLLLRFGFGLGQAGAYPTSANLVSKWMPFSARGKASSAIAFGGRIGGALAPLLTALLLVQFVPLSTSSLIRQSDLLHPSRLCYELKYGKESSHPRRKTRSQDRARKLGREILRRMPPLSRAAVSVSAADYADALNLAPSQAKGNDKPVGRPAAHLPRPDEPTVEAIATGLNRALRRNALITQEDAEGIPLSGEAKKLLKIDAEKLTETQTERLNRLVLEAVFPESIRKVYGAGWRYVMFAYGLTGLVVAQLFWIVARDRPANHPGCNEAEMELIRQGRPAEATQPDGRVRAVPLVRLLKSRSMWLCCLMQWCTNVGWVFLVTWLPRYLDTVHRVPVEQRGIMAFVPLVVGWLGMLSGGALTDWMVRMVGLRWGRALPMSLSRFLAMSAYIACLFDPSPWLAVAAFSVVAFSTDLGTGAVWAFNQDVGGRYVGSVLGWGNMWGNLGAAMTPPLLIWIVGESPHQNWNLAFMTCAGAFFISGLAALGVNATAPIAPDEGTAEN